MSPATTDHTHDHIGIHTLLVQHSGTRVEPHVIEQGVWSTNSQTRMVTVHMSNIRQPDPTGQSAGGEQTTNLHTNKTTTAGEAKGVRANEVR